MDARDDLLASAQRAGRLPSVVGGLVGAGGQLVWHGSAGEWAGREGGWPADPLDVQYRIGSITKTMTAVLLWQASTAGLLDLDGPVSAYVPGAPFGDRTVRLVMGHAAGLPKEPAGPWWERSVGGDRSGLLAANADRAPMAGQGEEFRYSNLGYGLLGAVLEEVLGRPWRALVGERVLAPLGMDRTTYDPQGPHAQGWSVRHLEATLAEEPATDAGAMAPAGQLWSTLGDMATYAGFVLSGHPDVLPLSVLQEASHEVLPGSGYAGGFRLDGGLVGHTGSMPGFMATLFCDRDRGTAYVGMANATVGHPSLPLARAMLGEAPARPAVAAQHLVTWRPQPGVPDDVAPLLGSWCWGERPFELRWDQGPSGEAQLELVELRPEHAYEEYVRRGDTWLGTDGTELEVVRDETGRVDHLVTETYELRRRTG